MKNNLVGGKMETRYIAILNIVEKEFDRDNYPYHVIRNTEILYSNNKNDINSEVSKIENMYKNNKYISIDYIYIGGVCDIIKIDDDSKEKSHIVKWWESHEK